MAARKTPDLDPDALYTVTLTRVAEGPFGPLSPAKPTQLRGRFIAALGDAVASAEKIDEPAPAGEPAPAAGA